MKYVTDEMLRMVGSSITYQAPEPVGLASIRYFALSVDDRNPLYSDQAFAATTRFKGVIAPPTLVCESLQYSKGTPDENGYIGHHWEIPLPPCRNIRGGNEYEFFEPVRPTDRLAVTWTLAEMFERETTTRGLVIFVISEIKYRNEDGVLLATNRETLIYEPLGQDGSR